jgi:hypothetical protein
LTPDISDFACPYMPKEEIWKAADKFRSEFWPEENLPIDMEKIIEERLGLNIEPKHNLHLELDIDAYLRVDLTGVIVDYDCYMNEKYMNRLRFSLAHELGHLFLHRDIYKRFKIDDTDAWKYFMQNIPEQQYTYFEYQANEFAGRTLVPRDRLIKEIEICLNKVQELGLSDLIAKDPNEVLYSMSAALCKPFGVSNQVIELRVKREELWPPE